MSEAEAGDPPLVDPVAVSPLAGDTKVAAEAGDSTLAEAGDSTLAEAGDSTQAAAGDSTQAAAGPKATPAEVLKEFVNVTIPTYQKKASQRHSDYTPRKQENTQSRDQEIFKASEEATKNKIKDEIKQINSKADEKYKELSILYKAAKTKYDSERNEKNYAELNEISVAFDALYEETSSALDKIQKDLDGDTTPTPLRWGKSLGNYWFNIFEAKFKKSQLENNALIISEDTMDELGKISKKMEQDIENGEEANLSFLTRLVNLAKDIARQNAPPTTPSPGPDFLGDAAKTLTEGEIPDANTAAALVPKAGPLATLPAPPAPLAAVVPEAASLAAVAAGGGISRKRSDPKYINQISENRNKIFKKELEIINSIRRFHRSHTIRKRDKINSILGFKKSKNNRNRNHGNTKRHRHQHRHNNHKHKSAKHIKSNIVTTQCM